MKTKHEIIAMQMYDAFIKCSCSWSLTTTGEMTKAELKKEFEKHIYHEFVYEWEKTHSISKAPSFTSWKSNYKN